ncbi:hypothetical protein GTZ99_07260 [Novosphingobium sp. FSY-8]|uniref:Sensory transduction regulator n=1 Tax=Novosphingobium ovatum TaxID=1908523 RepID=A0ABW9XCV9_9SPHN|nr:YbjN domain-containing protein [Novosphingobium ovatum]NBC36355.1 hypothetical protein [Novosphingobium ovatum]
MLRSFIGAAAVLASVAFSPAASAQQSSGQIRASNPDSVVAALQRAGYRADFSRDSGGDPMITSASSGKTFIIFFYGCDSGNACKSIQFYAGFPGARNASFEALNTWNAKRRFGRAYRADNGAARVEMDIQLTNGGISDALFTDNLDLWTSLMAKFDTYVNN